MRAELNNRLIEQFPNLFSRSVYVECGDGWYELLHDCCTAINKEVEQLRLTDDEFDGSVFSVTQIKEKYGTLRFYMGPTNENMDKAITEAERLSAVTCEKCGKLGASLRGRSWLYTSCSECCRPEDVSLISEV